MVRPGVSRSAPPSYFSLVAYVITVRLHGVLLYVDSISHLEIARRVVSSTSPGLAQLGYVWLPLPHLLMLPLVWINPLYQNGFAGSIVSMTAYVATAVLIYKIAFSQALTGRKFAGVVAAAVSTLNVNMLYMQSTPMTEALLFCMLAAMVYCVQQWADTDRYQYLVAGAVAALCATLTRYESRPVLACLMVAVAVIAWQRPHRRLTPKIRRASTGPRCRLRVVACAGIARGCMELGHLRQPAGLPAGDLPSRRTGSPSGEPFIGNWSSPPRRTGTRCSTTKRARCRSSRRPGWRA